MTPPTSGGPIDEAVLTRLSRNALGHPLVTATALEPTVDSPTRLRVSVDGEQYPATVETARVDARWFETGDFTLHYAEQHADGSPWQCRWDRHPNPHSMRTHFHEPPDASTVREFPVKDPHPVATLHFVLDWIEGRIERTWE